MQYSIYDLKNDIETVRKQLISLGYSDMQKKNIVYCFSTRAEKFLGLTSRIKEKYPNFTTGQYYYYKIKINQNFINCSEHDKILNTVAHEMCHCVDGCMNHKEPWKIVINKMNQNFGYHISRLANLESIPEYANIVKEKYEQNKNNYVIRCKKCNYSYHYQKRGKIVQKFIDYQIMGKEPSIFTCPICKSHSLYLETNIDTTNKMQITFKK